MNVIKSIYEVKNTISNLGESLEDQFQKEIYKRTLDNLLIEYFQKYWVTKDQKEILISELETTHIAHILLIWAEVNIYKPELSIRLEALSFELSKRVKDYIYLTYNKLESKLPLVYRNNTWNISALHNYICLLNIRYPRTYYKRY